MNQEARVALAQLMRAEQHQATAINWLIWCRSLAHRDHDRL